MMVDLPPLDNEGDVEILPEGIISVSQIARASDKAIRSRADNDFIA